MPILKKIYIEITNRCNFHCPFCCKDEREKSDMDRRTFRNIAERIRPYTDYVYLHVLGEPLIHPQFAGIVEDARSLGLHVNLTTNGRQVAEQKEVLRSVRQINISLHDWEYNVPKRLLSTLLQSTLDAAMELSPSCYVNLRLWNRESADESSEFNLHIHRYLSERFHLTTEELEKDGNIRLASHLFLHNSRRFRWPSDENEIQVEKHCQGLRDHVAILVDGTVVPCCIDATGSMPLGNILTEDLGSILHSERALRIREGFQQHKAVEETCLRCGFH